MSAGGRAVALESPRRVDEGRLLLQSVVDELEERVSPWALARVVRSWALVNPSGHERFGYADASSEAPGPLALARRQTSRQVTINPRMLKAKWARRTTALAHRTSSPGAWAAQLR
jgi:hypothetical protein